MALARTNLIGVVAAEGSPATAAYTTSAFTPPDNSLLVVTFHAMQNTASTSIMNSMTVSDSTSRVWTKGVQSEITGQPYTAAISVWTAPITTGVSMTVSVDCGAIDLWTTGVSVVAYTGYDTTTPTGGKGTVSFNPNPDGPFSITMDAAPAAADETIAAITIDKETLGCTPGSAFTELYDLQVGTTMSMEVEVRTGSTSTTADWVDVHTGAGGAFKLAGAALVIKAGATVTADGYLEQEDGTSKILQEDGTSALMGEAWSGATTVNANLSDTAAGADSLSEVQNYARSLADTAAGSDSLTAQWNRDRTLADTAAGADSLVVPYANYDAAVTGDGAIHYWKWDDASGSTVADSIGSNPMTFIAGGTWTRNATKIAPGLGPSTSMLADGVEADGSPISGGGLTNWTFEEWLYPTQDMSAGIVNLGNFFAILNMEIVFGGLVANLNGVGNISGGTNVPVQNSPNHFVVTNDGTTLKIYLNNALIGSGSSVGGSPLQNQPRMPLGQERPWAGRISNQSVYPSALTASQIDQHYNLGMTGPPQTVNQNPSDTAAGADSLTAQWNRSAGLADTAAGTDALGQTADRARTVADTAAGADALLATATRAPSVSDVASGSDALAGIYARDAQLADTATGSDSLTSFIARIADLADTAAGADSLTITWTRDRLLTDASIGSDALSEDQSFDRALADTAAGADSLTVVWSFDRQLADAATGSDSLSSSGSASIGDIATGTDSLAVTWTRTGNLADAAAGSDSLTGGVGLSKSLSDTAAGADSLSATMSRDVTLPPDTALGLDSLSASWTRQAQLADTATGSDSLSASQSSTGNANINDVANGVDTLSVVWQRDRSLADTAAGTDGLGRAVTIAALLADVATGTDALTMTASRSRSLASSAAGSDLLLGQVILAIGLRVGSAQVTKVFLGTVPVKAMYLGTERIL